MSYFANLLFFLPYLALYATGWLLHWDPTTLKHLFWVLHAGQLGLLGALLARKLTSSAGKKTPDWGALAFWLGLALVLLGAGGYYEYPGDPWEHLRRIYSWSYSDSIATNETRQKFAYFWNWTWVSEVPPLYRLQAMGMLGAFWQLLVAAQVGRLARAFGWDKQWARVSVVAFFCLFGTDVFGFRYYAQSTTPLALAAYLAFLTLLLSLLDRGLSSRASLSAWIRSLPAALALGALMAANHAQELLFAFVSTAGLLLLEAWQRIRFLQKPGARRALLVAVAAILLSGFFFRPFYLSLAGLDPSNSPFFSRWSGFKIWDMRFRFGSTYGLHGLISLIASVTLFKRNPRLCWLTLWPALLLLLPPTAALYARALPAQDLLYRLVYAFPTSFAFTLALQELFTRGRWQSARAWAPASACLLVAGAIPLKPWYGRLFFALYQPPAARTLSGLAETAQWIRDHRSYSQKCWLASDDDTEFAMSGLLGHPLEVDYRRYPQNNPMRFTRIDKYYYPEQQKRICAFLVRDPLRLPAPTPSLIGQWSGHWGNAVGDPQAMITDAYVKAMDQLPSQGWSKTSLPPYYHLYEPPEPRDGSP